MPYAVKVTKENVQYIIDWMSQYNFNVDYIRDDLEFDAYDGEFYAITDGSELENNVTFTTMSKNGFDDYWYFPHGEDTIFRIIDRKL